MVPVHPMPEPGERPQHQGRADRGHQVSTRRARGRGARASNARAWRAATTPAPGRPWATRSQGHRLACPSGEGVPDRGPPVHQASGHSTSAGRPWATRSTGYKASAGQTVGNQVTAWHATSGGGVGVVPVRPTPAPGERPSTSTPAHQATRPAPGVPPAVEVCQWCMGLATRSQGQHPASGHSTSAGQIAGNQATRPAPGVPVVKVWAGRHPRRPGIRPRYSTRGGQRKINRV